MSKILSEHTIRSSLKQTRSNRNKSMLLWLVIITTILGLLLVSRLFNSNPLSLDIGNTPIKQALKRHDHSSKTYYTTLDKVGESFHFGHHPKPEGILKFIQRINPLNA